MSEAARSGGFAKMVRVHGPLWLTAQRVASPPDRKEAMPQRQDLHPTRVKNPEAKRPKAPDKDFDKLVKKAWDAGWWCFRGRKYIFCRSQDGETVVKIASTPSDWRTLRNTTRDFRAGGLDV